MSSEHSVTDDIVYDMISIQYHAMKSVNVYDKYLADCHDHDDVAEFIRQCRQEDEARIDRAHDLIKSLMQSPEFRAAQSGGAGGDGSAATAAESSGASAEGAGG
jgi:hypothetical protein